MSLATRPGLVPFLFVSLLFGPSVVRATSADESIRQRLEDLQYAEEPLIGDSRVSALPMLSEVYARREYRPAWTDPERVDELLRVIGEMRNAGLDPDDYQLADLQKRVAQIRRAAQPDPVDLADLDILLTEAMIRVGYHLRFGKVDPHDLDQNWNLSRSIDGRDPAATVAAALEADSLRLFARDRLIDLPLYRILQDYLVRYIELAERGGWPLVPPGPTLKPGTRDPRVQVLRRRLEATGDLQAGSSGAETFDGELVAAVERFQNRHGLDVDGAVGPRTLEALNVPVEDRVDQIRVNLERLRWVFRDTVGDFLVANIAAFELYLFRDGKMSWRTRTMVGKEYRKTPVFKGSMKYLVFNPTWTVPPTILRNDVLPQIKKDRAYLTRKNMSLIDRQGRTVDPSTIDWDNVSSRNFAYAVRQGPGPANALGRVKFIFPNAHFVFLHDTPSRGLFGRSKRAFSSGCIRVEDPLELAERLLDDPGKWDEAAIETVLDSGKITTVHLPEPMDVMLLYMTAYADPETGELHLLDDIYARDAKVLAALDADFEVKLPEGVEDLAWR